MSIYVPDSWALPFLFVLFFLFFTLPIAGLVTLGMWFQRKSGSEILRVLGIIFGGFAALFLLGAGIGYLESMFGIPSWFGRGLTTGIVIWIVLMRKRIGVFLTKVGNALSGNAAR